MWGNYNRECSRKSVASGSSECLREPLEDQSPERLKAVAAYASELAEWSLEQREVDHCDEELRKQLMRGELKELDEREISTGLAGYEDVPVGKANVTVKTTKETADKAYRHYYSQWREGDSKPEYIALVNPN